MPRASANSEYVSHRPSSLGSMPLPADSRRMIRRCIAGDNDAASRRATAHCAIGSASGSRCSVRRHWGRDGACERVDFSNQASFCGQSGRIFDQTAEIGANLRMFRRHRDQLDRPAARPAERPGRRCRGTEERAGAALRSSETRTEPARLVSNRLLAVSLFSDLRGHGPNCIRRASASDQRNLASLTMTEQAPRLDSPAGGHRRMAAANASARGQR